MSDIPSSFSAVIQMYQSMLTISKHGTVFKCTVHYSDMRPTTPLCLVRSIKTQCQPPPSTQQEGTMPMVIFPFGNTFWLVGLLSVFQLPFLGKISKEQGNCHLSKYHSSHLSSQNCFSTANIHAIGTHPPLQEWRNHTPSISSSWRLHDESV
jgi:hypothetical protein